MSDSSKPTEIAGGVLEDLFNQILKAQIDSMTELKNIQTNSQSLFQNEHDRLAQKLRNDHPRVIQLSDRIEKDKAIANDLESLIQIAQIEETPSDGTKTIINGRITKTITTTSRKISISLPDFSVQLVDKQGAVFGTAKTNKVGYYSLELDDDSVKKLGGGAFVNIYDPQNKPIKLGIGPVPIQSHQVTYYSIDL